MCMQRLLVFLLCFCAGLAASAQLLLQPSVPVTGPVQRNQLWNLVVLNNSGAAISGRLELVIADRVSMQEYMTASTALITIPNGPKALSVNSLNPIAYNYIGIQPDNRLQSLLPVGEYTACYSFIKDPDSDKRELLAEECVQFDVEPLSPPMLSFPADSAILETAPAQFSWIPPAPVAMLPELQYDVLITALQPAQQAGAAIQDNIPFYQDRLATNFLSYSGAQASFEKETWYAWQVIARNKDQFAGKSEVWVFKVADKKEMAAELNATPYLQLKRNNTVKTIVTGSVVRFSYFNQLADKEVKLFVQDISDKATKDKAPVMLPVTRGLNLIQKDISKLVRAEEGHLYRLSVENSAGEIWSIMFEVKKN